MASCNWICIGEYVFLSLWLISVPTYCIVIYAILKKRKTKFKGEFWPLTISIFVADMLHLCQTMLGTKLPSWGYLPSVFVQKPSIFGRLMISPKPAFMCAEILGVIFVSINRYVAIKKPFEYKVLWTRKHTICCICAQWAVAGFVFLGTFNVRYILFRNPNNNDTFVASIDLRDKKFASVFFGIVLGLGGMVRIPLFAFLYGRMFYYVYKQNRSTETFGNTNNTNQRAATLNKGEFNLAIMGSLLALCDMAITLHAIDMAVQRQTSGRTKLLPDREAYYSFRLKCITDIYGWMNGWLLLVFCEMVRKQVRTLFVCKTSTQVQPAGVQQLNRN